MTNDNISPEDIEREIERERAGLKDSIEDLQNRFSFDGVVQQIGEQFREHGGEFSRSIAQSARDNPVALALTGVGLAWMIFGNSSNQGRPKEYDSQGQQSGARRWGGDVPDYAARRGASYTGPKTAARHSKPRPEWARDGGAHNLADSHGAAGPSLGERVSGAGASVKSSLASARDAASGAADDVAQAAGGATQSVRDTAESIRSSASHGAEGLKRRLYEGTEHLSEEARDRIAAARTRAIEARNEATQRLSRGADQVSDFYDEHPLVVGGIAFAIGAALAGALPHTRLEDEYVGAYSDDLYDEAERIYAEETEKAQKVVKAGMDEAKVVASEMKADTDEAVDAALDKVKSAATRVADAAKQTAEDENLGGANKDS